jgi:(1->4)-alpha-D-glucan 1-alpha-D-glucosylmutase
VSPALRLNIDTAVARFNGRAGDPASFDDLHELLEQQAYRLAYWRVAADEINYRRFFDINDLAGLRMERPEVFAATHRRVLALIASGQLHGLRIDHPDGLYDPADYYARLEQAVAAALERSEALPLYVIVEKILAPGETLPAGWRVHGTTGYDFASQLNGLFVHPDGEQPLSRLYARLLGSEPRFVDEVYAGKKIVMRTLMAGELQVLAGLLDRLSESDRDTRDYTLPTLRDALLEYVACLPVYRTYISAGGATDADRQFAARALRQARRRSPAGGESVYGFLEQLLLGHGSGATPRPELAHFLMKLQQYSAPVMAKGLEDTALYRYCRLTSLNEVGTDPRLFGLSLDAFHRASHERARHWPHSLLATSTHDTKRSEDVRARIHVLSELTQPWTALVQRWVRRHRHLKRDVDDAPAPAANDEYLLYQTLVGIWPYGQVDDAALTSLRDRVAAYLRKAVREAKVHSGWLNPNAAYEGAVDAFGSALLGSRAGNRFLDDFLPFQRQVARLGALNSLAQSLIKLTAPGVPDIYQGNELFDFSLVDPDNRRPVDYERRQTLLAELRLLPELAPAARAAAVRAMLDDDPPDRAKLYLIWTVLTRRAAEPELFRDGDYRPLAVRGPLAAHVCAYARTTGARRAVTVAARWFNRLLSDAAGTMPEPAAWGSTEIGLPPADTPYVDALTGRDHYPRPDGTGAWLPLTEVLADFPVTLLMTGPQAGRQ